MKKVTKIVVIALTVMVIISGVEIGKILRSKHEYKWILPPTYDYRWTDYYTVYSDGSMINWNRYLEVEGKEEKYYEFKSGKDSKIEFLTIQEIAKRVNLQ